MIEKQLTIEAIDLIKITRIHDEGFLVVQKDYCEVSGEEKEGVHFFGDHEENHIEDGEDLLPIQISAHALLYHILDYFGIHYDKHAMTNLVIKAEKKEQE